MGDLLGKYRSLQVYLDSCVKCGACTDKCHYFLGHGRSQEHAGGAPGPDAQGLSALFHAGRQVLPQAGRRRGPHQGGAGRVVQLLPPVLRVPALLGVLPLSASTPPRSPWPGARFWTASATARSTATRSSARSTRSAITWVCRSQRWRDTLEGLEEEVKDGHRGRCALSAGRERRRSPARSRLPRTSSRSPTSMGLIGYGKVFHEAGISLDAQLLRLGGGQLRHLHRQLPEHAESGLAHPRGGPGSRGQAHRRGRVRARLARGLQLLEYA